VAAVAVAVAAVAVDAFAVAAVDVAAVDVAAVAVAVAVIAAVLHPSACDAAVAPLRRYCYHCRDCLDESYWGASSCRLLILYSKILDSTLNRCNSSLMFFDARYYIY
jgi:hypothetical protein